MPEVRHEPPRLEEPLAALRAGRIVGVQLMEAARWVNTSAELGTTTLGSRLLLPPIQRSAVWRWSQVLAFWDSVFRGMPVGSFYVMPWHGHCQKGRDAKGAGPETVDAREGDYFLLDGQQRLRALLAGLGEKNADNRCLWIDLTRLGNDQDSGKVLPCLFLTSEAQPFGYDSNTGNKLRAQERRNARDKFSKGGDEAGPGEGQDDQWLWQIPENGSTAPRRAYNQDLYGHVIELRNGSTRTRRLATPPRPFKASAATIPLWKLIKCCGPVDGSSDAKPVRLREILSRWDASTDPDINAAVTKQARDMSEKSLIVLRDMLARLDAGQVALIPVKVSSRPVDVQEHDLPLLFTRIGAGGSPLTEQERLYSIYKHYVPEVHTLVEEIYRGVGRVLPPTGIAMTALRIANVESKKDDPNAPLGTPDEKVFTKEMRKSQDAHTPLMAQLERLLPQNGKGGPLQEAFQFLYDAVTGKPTKGQPGIDPKCPFWIPDVMLANLSQNLWQVLAYWAVKNSGVCSADQSRRELVRFILFWHLCVQNDDKAGNRAFDAIRQQAEKQSRFPGQALYEALIDKVGGNPLALELSSPEQVCEVISIKEPEPGLWPSWNERFENPKRASNPSLRKAEQMAARWWPRNGGGEHLLPWLQRHYIAKMFADYVPLNNHEDDLPYDVDHICAASRFHGDWRTMVFPDLILDDERDKLALKKIRDNRGLMGNSIGNLQLLAMSENRGVGDAHHSKKIPTDKISMEHSWWRQGPELDQSDNEKLEWGQEERANFQAAVEQRAVHLYRRFFDDLAYQDEWAISSKSTAIFEAEHR